MSLDPHVSDPIADLARFGEPLVFAGPSVEGLPQWMRRKIQLRPPARRGDLEALRAQRQPGRVVLLDGLFGASMAVTPTECRQLLEDGWQVVGASSIGALRASELWSVGMIGVGEIYTMLRMDIVTADAELAVAYHPDTHRELTYSLVHVRAAVASVADTPAMAELAPTLLHAAQAIYWPERSRARLQRAWTRQGLSEHQLARLLGRLADPELHPKHKDARLAVQCALASDWVLYHDPCTSEQRAS
ncbi:MAG: hypothetical protein K0V04_38100 [Deltaproteobacteria bacterium]|nr:hypothetical protein [Deltaproteobacteria bacterium]